MGKITLSGLAGSGKSTIGKMLAAKLNYKFVSVGDFSRRYAMEKYGADINQFQQICKENPDIDRELDKEFEQFGKVNDNFVIDYRLGSLFIPDGFHVYLDVSDLVAAKRVKMNDRGNEFNTDNIDVKMAVIISRNQIMIKRFIDLYNFNFTLKNNYNLVVNTDNHDAEEIVNYLLDLFK